MQQEGQRQQGRVGTAGEQPIVAGWPAPPGSPLAKERADGTVLTLRRGAEKHFVAAMAVITTVVGLGSLCIAYLAYRQSRRSEFQNA